MKKTPVIIADPMQATNNKRINKMKERRKEKIVSSSTQSIAF
jgi:uracil phosphoribosyltransferase